MKKLIAILLVLTMTLALAACGGSGTPAASGSDKADSAPAAASTGVSFTIFNSKMEIQEQFEDLAERYSKATGVDVEVYYSSDTVAAHLSTKYASNDPYTLSMVDAKDIYTLGPEFATDLSGEKWVANTTNAISVDGKVMGFPVCVEARGVIYNATAIKNITGKDFDPASVATLDAFKALLDELVAGGMEAPCGILKEDWSLSAHYLMEIIEEQPDVNAFVDGLYAGTVDLMSNAKYNSMMDTFETLMAYNYAKSSPIAAEREVTMQKLGEGEIAFCFGGNWDWSVINAYDYTDGLGMMPVPQNMDDGSNTKLVGGGSKYFFVDSSSNTSDEQRQAAKDFLNWLVFDADGNKFLTDECALVPAYSNITGGNLDPLGTSVKAFADKGALIDNFNYAPDDHISMMGAAMQKLLAGQIDRAGFAAEMQNYWASTTPVPHN